MFADTEGFIPVPVWSMQHPYIPDGESFIMPGGMRLDLVYTAMGCDVKRVMEYHRPWRDMAFGVDGYIIDTRKHDVINGYINFHSTSLRSFCTLAKTALNNSRHPIETFIQYRYHIMSKSFPHNVFGTNRADSNFFDETLRLLSYPGALKEELHKAVREQHTYEIEYLKWVKTHSDIELSMQYVKP